MIIECSEWLFPAIFFSGWLSPLVFLLSCIWEVLQKWL